MDFVFDSVSPSSEIFPLSDFLPGELPFEFDAPACSGVDPTLFMTPLLPILDDSYDGASSHTEMSEFCRSQEVPVMFQSDLEAISSPSEMHQLTPKAKRKKMSLAALTADQRLSRRRQKNRLAAQESRQRKQVKLCTLEDEVANHKAFNDTLNAKNDALRFENEKLASEVKRLRSELEYFRTAVTQVIQPGGDRFSPF
jgi:cell division protein FtsB